MNQLKVIEQNGKFVVDSREVAEMVGKRHDNLTRDIRGYEDILKTNPNMDSFRTTSKLSSLDFFIPSTYQDSKGEERPCYLLTRKGCDMVANKMTGEKGVLFTAEYVTKFEEMERHIQQSAHNPTCLEDVLIQSLQEMKAIKQQVSEAANTARIAIAETTEVKNDLQNMRDTILLDPTNWRTDTTKIINSIAKNLGGIEHIRNVRTEAYQLLDKRLGVCLEQRLTNRRRRMAEEGVCKSKRDKFNQLDVIADDKKLIEGFVAIVKQMAVKYGTTDATAF